MNELIGRAFAVGLTLSAGASLAGAESPRPLVAQAHNPCAARNPCAVKNPCAGKNPCAPKNSCAAKGGAAAKDPAAQAATRQYKDWKKVNTEPVLSATHGNRYVFTYVNRKAEPSALNGRFPFPVGAVLVKESFEAQAGKPGDKGPVFVMEKRGKGYDAAHADWHWAILEAGGSVSMTAAGRRGAQPTSAPPATLWRRPTTMSSATGRS